MPQLASVLGLEGMSAFDETSYAASASLVDFLLTKGDEQTLLQFAADGQRGDWDSALLSNFGIAGVGQLQSEWESWLVHRLGPT
jgi:hypothetical protein